MFPVGQLIKFIDNRFYLRGRLGIVLKSSVVYTTVYWFKVKQKRVFYNFQLEKIKNEI